MKPTQVMIEGNLWAILPSKRGEMAARDNDGECNFDDLTIRVYRDLGRHAQLETVIHEVMHAQQPDMTEEAITRRAREITRALIRTGVFHQR